jgi:hypothetical protein
MVKMFDIRRHDGKFVRRSPFTYFLLERDMGLLDEVGKIAGAVAAVEAAEKVDPQAGLLTKGIAAIAGYEGAGKLESMLEKKDEDKQDDADNAQAADDASAQT